MVELIHEDFDLVKPFFVSERQALVSFELGQVLPVNVNNDGSAESGFVIEPEGSEVVGFSAVVRVIKVKCLLSAEVAGRVGGVYLLSEGYQVV